MALAAIDVDGHLHGGLLGVEMPVGRRSTCAGVVKIIHLVDEELARRGVTADLRSFGRDEADALRPHQGSVARPEAAEPDSDPSVSVG